MANVTNMRGLFVGATAFNGDLSQWDVANVTVMSCMFREASAFHGDVSQWNVANVRWGKALVEQRIRVTIHVQRFALHAYETAVALRVQRVYRTRAFLRLGPSTHTPASLAALGSAELKAMLDWHPSRAGFGECLRQRGFVTPLITYHVGLAILQPQNPFAARLLGLGALGSEGFLVLHLSTQNS